MAQREPSAAQALYGHLPSAAREPVKQRERSLADSMWPGLSREAKREEFWQAWAREQQKVSSDIRNRPRGDMRN